MIILLLIARKLTFKYDQMRVTSKIPKNYTMGDFHLVVWGCLGVVWNVLIKTGPGTDNTILVQNSYKMVDAADLMAAPQAFLLLLVILRRRRRQR